MKKIFFAAFALLSVHALFAQTPSAEISRDASGNKVVKGFLTKQELLADTAFAWFPSGQKSFVPNADAVKGFAAGKDAVNIVVFGGTWCEDTHMVLPKFYATADAAGFAPDRITLIGVDHSKKTLYNLSEAFGITNVPTFIVMKGGKEIGRVVEYGTSGYPEREVAGIVAGAAKK
jgi:thiol-disulfide isomerase/thioredoxin